MCFVTLESSSSVTDGRPFAACCDRRVRQRTTADSSVRAATLSSRVLKVMWARSEMSFALLTGSPQDISCVDHLVRGASMINQVELNSPVCDSGEQESEIEAAWLVALDRRVAELDAGRAETLPRDVVRSRPAIALQMEFQFTLRFGIGAELPGSDALVERLGAVGCDGRAVLGRGVSRFAQVLRLSARR